MPDWTVGVSDDLWPELRVLPPKVQRAFHRRVIRELRREGPSPRGDTIKKLSGWRRMYRYRIGDYRIIFEAQPETRSITLLRAGHRREIYERLSLNDDGAPSTTLLVSTPAELLEPDYPPAPHPTAPQPNAVAELAPEPLPRPIDADLLDLLEIPEQYHRKLLGVSTGDDLLSLVDTLPDEAGIERVWVELYPPPLTETLSSPAREIREGQVEQILAGELVFESLSLVLDPDQREFLGRIRSRRPSGPWLVKGGPGSGKSLIGVYAIKRIVELEQQELALDKPLRILFTTYTHALTRTAEAVLKALLKASPQVQWEVLNADRVVNRYVQSGGWTYPKDARAEMRTILSELGTEGSRSPLSAQDAEFVLDEIKWVVLGRAVESLEDYLSIVRVGRGRPLRPRQRERVWHAHGLLRERLNAKGRRLYDERPLDALKAIEDRPPRYDYVFIDEAQDLTLSTLRFLARLAPSTEGLFVTADGNQSIYGSGMPWKEVSDELRFTGRGKIFRRNYRNPRELWQAVLPLAEGLRDVDHQTTDVETPRTGRAPLLLRYSGTDEPTAVRRALEYMANEARDPWSKFVVLARTSALVEQLAEALPAKMNAKAMASRDFKVRHPGVRVCTMHAAKGLEFPNVVIAGLNSRFPRASADSANPEPYDRDRRLLFVSATRATRNLALVAPAGQESPLIHLLDPDQWRQADVSSD